MQTPHPGIHISGPSTRHRTIQADLLFCPTQGDPNKLVSVLPNTSAQKKRRVDLLVDIAYDADLKKAKEIIEALVASEENVLCTEPASQRFLDQHTKSFCFKNP